MINRLFTSHPESVGETYLEHMSSASTFGLHLMLAGLACTVHAILPFLFKTTARSAITDLHEKMVTHRHRSDRIGVARGTRTVPNSVRSSRAPAQYCVCLRQSKAY